jgi:serine-type D-Ala-D-Ala carboxypeptidase/endopeptidase (penicillin-binding protein 4)
VRRASRLTVAIALVALLAGCTGDGSESVAPSPDDVVEEAETPEAAPSVPPAPASPAPAPDLEPATPEPASRQALTASLEGVLTAAGTAAPDLELGVLVSDEVGREVVALHPDRPMLPASTLKQVTAAAALTTLGPNAQLRTLVEATAGIDGTGRLEGDLLLVGAGDPTLVTDEYARFIYPARPRTPLSSLADQLVAAGLTHLTGDVRGTAPAFAPPSLPTGWRDDYLNSLGGGGGAGLTFDGGLRTSIELPDLPDRDGDEERGGGGEDEPSDDLEAGAGAGAGTGPGRGRSSVTAPISVLDQLAALDTDLPPTVRVSLAEDPALHTAAELTRLLEERGVQVDGKPTVEAAVVPAVARLAVVTSPPLTDVLRFALQRSDNHLADALALAVARARTGEGSWSGAHRAFHQVLARFDVPAEGAAFADGSGLSRDDRAAPRLLVELDRRLTGDVRFGGEWRSLQAVAGRSGTLDRRLLGTPVEGRLLAKTGTLRDVVTLSGQVIGRDADPAGPPVLGERRYHLAVLGNGADAAGRGVVRAVIDEVVLALTADLDGCRLVPAGDEDGPLGRPPSEVRCRAN